MKLQDKKSFNDSARTEEKHLRVHVLASGSKGNCTAIEYGSTLVLHDVGISARRITKGLKNLHIDMSRLAAIFISHEHSDHIAGLEQMLKQYDVPVYTKQDTWRALLQKKELPPKRLIPITRSSFEVGNLEIEPFSTSHDAVDPIGISYFGGLEKATVLTDTGVVDDTMLKYLDDSTKLVLEANYDPYMLRTGPYTYPLKQRVGGNHGHLSNESAAQALLMMKRPDYMQVILAHRSENNNTLSHVTQTIGKMLVDGGIKIGPHMYLQHGQPNMCVSMTEKKGTYDTRQSTVVTKNENHRTKTSGKKSFMMDDSRLETLIHKAGSEDVEAMAAELVNLRNKK